MPFNSITFIIFFILVYTIYRCLPHRAQNYFLLFVSYVFFGWWDVRFLFLIFFSTALDFACGLMIAEGRIPSRKRLGLSLGLPLSALFFLVMPWSRQGPNGWGLITVLGRFTAWNNGWLVVAGMLLLVLAFNLFYPGFVRLEGLRRRKLFLLLSIAGNLTILCLFQYFNFFLENIEAIVRTLGGNPGYLHLNIILPVGISFYTFMTMSYAIDVYKGRLSPATKFHEYALFVAFFPKLLAGPIERAGNFLPQISAKRTISAEHLIVGFQQILFGLFKKVVIADGVAKSGGGVFGATYQLTWADAIVGTLLFTFQIYCDFSGYSDIATGTSSLLGFNLMRNFNLPYFSRNPSEFWGRWHISLSSWFRDYVFFPLGGPYGRTLRWIRNILITFFVTGLWHGAAWNFILWGLYHGVLLCLHRLKEMLRAGKKRSKSALKKAMGVGSFFVLTSFGWILFRCRSIDQIIDFLRVLVNDFGNLRLNIEMPTKAALIGFPLFFLMEILGNKFRGKRLDAVFPIPIWTAAYAAMIFLIIMGLANVPSGFIYFVF
ncbi:MAG: MBOAT family protein [Syntrophobacterales bacterium]|nr:MAG: MBOAT family protein [Syntrophobacterales bacterium]